MVQTLQNFINGSFVTPAGSGTLDIVNPTNGEVVARSPISNQEDVDAAMAAAKEAFKSWKHVTPGQRQLML
ncbi:MAG: aldehyde dehydrogenase, partial [Pseudarthrobacter sp.]|nr:aldehyde dehydrogenase [Pseudarthrobacter sp.]